LCAVRLSNLGSQRGGVDGLGLEQGPYLTTSIQGRADLQTPAEQIWLPQSWF
jgi:hypothetical protein